MTDTRYLTKRRQGYYVEIEIPPSLRETMGKKRLVKSLGTRELNVARAKRWETIAALKAQIEAARKGSAALPLEEEALGYRRALMQARGDAEADGAETGIRDRYFDLLGKQTGTGAFGDGEFDPESERQAGLFRDVAAGKATPLTINIDDWLSATGLPMRSISLHRRSINALIAWMKEEGLGSTVETVDRDIAHRFLVTFLFGTRGLNRKTITSYRWGLTDYWRWMVDAGRIKSSIPNPWEHQRLPKEQTVAARSAEGTHETERPFTAEELGKLLGGSPTPRTMDAMLFGALTGARLEAIFRLRVRDCDVEGGMLSVPPLKKEKAARALPSHPKLLPVIEARCKGKGPDAWLFDDIDLVKTGRERSMAESQAFGRYLRSLKLEQVRPDRRRSLVNFHSFRRWFITKAEEAGYPESLIALAVGHSRKGMTFGVYSKPDMQRQLKELVGSIVLPEPIPPDAGEAPSRRTRRRSSAPKEA
ncbi:tyrosine-type recombinase/integrase [Mesorhizobium sp. BR1-1-16]|uniref:DUF6538 domain-containing protein n=1 Tax=Mesorhizobium sp. BR1-1-16 TaxID=2876653 RepID=UPI001CCCE101|nr:DUF6538 domain-containing protein [Mesorhizobium sp. BR1-1-16]MBZ9939210.1 tyrosine-type recombinase/integrase [Mesorhizobium sp. BR1-1-16]